MTVKLGDEGGGRKWPRRHSTSAASFLSLHPGETQATAIVAVPCSSFNAPYLTRKLTYFEKKLEKAVAQLMNASSRSPVKDLLAPAVTTQGGYKGEVQRGKETCHGDVRQARQGGEQGYAGRYRRSGPSTLSLNRSQKRRSAQAGRRTAKAGRTMHNWMT